MRNTQRALRNQQYVTRNTQHATHNRELDRRLPGDRGTIAAIESFSRRSRRSSRDYGNVWTGTSFSKKGGTRDQKVSKITFKSQK